MCKKILIRIFACFAVCFIVTMFHAQMLSAASPKIAVVFRGNAMSTIYQASKEGILLAKSLGVPVKEAFVIGEPATYLSQLDAIAQDAQMIIAVNYAFTREITHLAEQYPEKDFVLVDSSSSSRKVTSALFRQNEGSYLAGVLAALVAKNSAPEAHCVGIVLGERGVKHPAMLDFLAGFEQGVHDTAPDITVLKESVESWNDAERAKSIALKMHLAGAPIIYHAAGNSGKGVIEAACERLFYVIGVDEAQERLVPGTVLTSMLKRYDKVILALIKRKLEGNFTRGKRLFYGLRNGGVSLSATSNALVPEALRSELNHVIHRIIAGKLYIQSYFDDSGNPRSDLQPLPVPASAPKSK